MNKLPSTLVFHKHADSTDTHYKLMGGGLAEKSLEKWLGVINHGAYQQAEGEPAWAFEPLASMWSDEPPVETDSESKMTMVVKPLSVLIAMMTMNVHRCLRLNKNNPISPCPTQTQQNWLSYPKLTGKP